MRVLIADDDQLMLESLRHVLDREQDIAIVGAAYGRAQVLPLVERRWSAPVPTGLSRAGCDSR